VSSDPEQLELLRAAVKGRRPRPVEPLAEQEPVAQLVLALPLPHLDGVFDYAVPQSLAATALPGVRCGVRFAGQQVAGFVVARTATSGYAGTLSRLVRVPSAEPVLAPEVLAAARAVADECAGTLADVLRLAVPPRHAATEKRAPAPVPARPVRPVAGSWTDYRGGQAFLDRVADGQAPRAVWTALPAGERGGSGWPQDLAVAALTAASAGRGVLVVVPDHRDVDRVAAAVADVGGLAGADQLVRLSAGLGPAARYAAFLAALRGSARIVLGTRAAAFAPVHDLGLVICWDDGDDSHAEPHAPYPHTRDVLRVRAEQVGAAALLGATARSVETQHLVHTGWARAVEAERAMVRRRAPRVVVSGDDDLRDPAARAARIPSLALRTAREALASGPVLVQVPRAGYLPSTACQRCRTPARCGRCSGPLSLPDAQVGPRCRWCAEQAEGWACAECGTSALRSVQVGVRRTAEEIGRALPGYPLRSSSAEAGVLAAVGPEPCVVLATPGAEPVAEAGYAAALLLDGWVPLARPDLRAGEEAVRRWFAAASLVRSASDGGRVVLVADAALAPAQALVRWDPAGFAARDLAERQELQLPPAAVMAQVLGTAEGVAALHRALRLPEGVTVLGPMPVEKGSGEGQDRLRPPDQRLLLRAPPALAGAVAAALSGACGVLSAAKIAHRPRVSMHPDDIG